MDLRGVLEIVQLTDVGRQREHNEDSIASNEEIGLVVLADGMGGYNAGEVASEMAVLNLSADLMETLTTQRPGIVDSVTGKQAEAQLILNAVKNTNQVIYSVSQSQPQCAGMGTTLVMGLFTNNKLLVGHIGDSRMYRLRNQCLTQITEDHSLLQEQIKSGLITTEQAKYSANKNLVTRALGVDSKVSLELNEYEVEVDDIYLLCSDGLTDLVDDNEIESVLNNSQADLTEAAKTLVQIANNNGGKDNISVILVKVKSSFEYTSDWLDNFFGWLKK